MTIMLRKITINLTSSISLVSILEIKNLYYLYFVHVKILLNFKLKFMVNAISIILKINANKKIIKIKI